MTSDHTQPIKTQHQVSIRQGMPLDPPAEDDITQPVRIHLGAAPVAAAVTKPVKVSPGRRLWVLSALFFFMFAGVGSYLSYLNIYYRQAGLSGTQIGLINMTTSIVGMVGAIGWGYLSDRTGKNKYILAFGALGALVTAQIIPLVHGFYAYLGLALFSAVVSSSLFSLMDSTTLVMLGNRKEDYGRFRLGGSIGYIITASTAGFIFDRVGMGIMFPIYGFCMGAFLIMSLFLPVLPVRHEAREKKSIGKLVGQPKLIMLLVVAFLVWVASNSAIMFLGVVLQSMGASQGLIGISITIGAVVEMPFMLFSGNLIRRFGPVKLLLVAIILSVLRYFLLGLIKNPEWTIAVNMLNGPAYVLFWNSAVNYINRLAPPGLTATAQGMFNMATSLAGVISSLITGILFDQLGSGLFEVMSVFCLVGLVLFMISEMRRSPAPERQSDAI